MTFGWGMISRVANLLLAVLLTGGCRHAPLQEDVGRSSFTVVDPPPAPPPKSNVESVEPLDRGQYRQEQLIQPATLPVYPARALKAKAGRATVGVHVTVGTDGRVSDIRSSILVFNTPGPFAGDFRDEVEAALHQWKFVPARVEYIDVVKGENGVYYNKVMRTELVESDFDLSFTFSADGRVEPTPAGK